MLVEPAVGGRSCTTFGSMGYAIAMQVLSAPLAQSPLEGGYNHSGNLAALKLSMGQIQRTIGG